MSARDSQPPSNPAASESASASATNSQRLAADLLRSAKLDQPTATARERALQAGLHALHTPIARTHSRRAVAAAIASSLALAAAFALYIRAHRERPPELRAEPVAPAQSARVGALTSAPSAHPPPLQTPLRPCPETVVATGSAPLIDDWEHTGSALPTADGRTGVWLTFDDGTAKQNFPSGSQPTSVFTHGGRSRRALHLRGGRFSDWGVVFGTDFANGACYDASAYAGIEFWAKGPARVHVGVQIIDIQSPKFGGFCEKDNCYNSHRKPVELDRTWKRYSVRWEELQQVRPTGTVPFDVRRIRFLEFALFKDDTPFDIWIDDVRFVSRGR
ncbi:MAG: hypothetical protein ACOY0T_23010 [Myxococcota bacterium]